MPDNFRLVELIDFLVKIGTREPFWPWPVVRKFLVFGVYKVVIVGRLLILSVRLSERHSGRICVRMKIAVLYSGSFFLFVDYWSRNAVHVNCDCWLLIGV